MPRHEWRVVERADESRSQENVRISRDEAVRRADAHGGGAVEQGEAGFGRCAASAREGEGGFADLAARPKPQAISVSTVATSG